MANPDKKLMSLRDLPQSVQPPRDLWAGIEAQIATERRSVSSSENARTNAPQRAARIMRMRWMAAAAMIATLAIGVWIGRTLLPTAGPTIAQVGPRTTAKTNTPDINGAAAVQAAYLSDPKFRAQRAALVQSLEAKMSSLPPESRAKVTSSLATIQKSIQDLEAALGKDPTNALLEELLLNTYQDEMRVLTTVHEAGDAGKGI